MGGIDGMSVNAPPDKIRHPKKAAMLAAIAKSGNVSASARAADIDRSTHYDWMHTDLEYAVKVGQAMEEAVDVLEAVARMRAIVGSDVLLIFLLKGHRPERYRERHDVKLASKVAVEERGDPFELLRDPEMLKAIQDYHVRKAIKQGKVPRDFGRSLPAPEN
jgi:hypothetical protein